ncbi:MAG: hypothetical protein ACD_34C00139G0001, partial [uncultured bacterium]
MKNSHVGTGGRWWHQLGLGLG